MKVLLLSCEHAGNEVPEPLRPLFAGHEEVLQTHRAIDLGAYALFRQLVPLADWQAHCTLSRLVVEMNRSVGNPALFSQFTAHLPDTAKAELIEKHDTYWAGFSTYIERELAKGNHVVHVGVHSFTPVLDGRERNLDIGLLFDPARANETAFCSAWKSELERLDPALRVAMNEPYRGTDDGLTTALRTRYTQGYAGIELEVNQRFASGSGMDPGMVAVVLGSLRAVLQKG